MSLNANKFFFLDQFQTKSELRLGKHVFFSLNILPVDVPFANIGNFIESWIQIHSHDILHQYGSLTVPYNPEVWSHLIRYPSLDLRFNARGY